VAERAARILIVGNEARELAALRTALAPTRQALFFAGSLEEAIAQLQGEGFDLALVSAGFAELPLPAALKALASTAGGRWLPTLALGEPGAVPRLLGLGADDALAHPFDAEELRARVQALLRARARVQQLTDEKLALEQLAITDGLTGLYNQRHLQRRLDDEFRRALRYAQPFALLLIDLDRFKQVNDTHGHPVGDAVLRHVSAVLRNQLRTTDLLARHGGEEFAAILPQTHAAGADLVARRLGAALEQSPFLRRGAQPISLTASIGVSHAPAPGVSTPDDLFAAADAALYRAKRAGRNQVVLAAPQARPRSRGNRRVAPH
jgi:diguanylate cyclase (GGDEF)-like protein